jgi:acyl carrier protein
MTKVVNLEIPVINFGVRIKGVDEYLTSTGTSIKISKKISIYNSRKTAEDLIHRATRHYELSASNLEVVEVEIRATVLTDHPLPVIDTSDIIAKISRKVCQCVAEQLGVKPSKVNIESTYESLGGDSLDAVEVLMYIEDEFNVEIDDRTAESFTGVKDIISYFSKITNNFTQMQNIAV